MADITIRNLPSGVHRALRVRAAQHGRSMEAEVRAIITATVQPPERVRMGSLMHAMARQLEITDDDIDALRASIRDARPTAPHEPIELD
jgi:plasmid stability protein